MFGSAVCSFLRAKGSFCSLDVLYGGLGIGIHPKMLDPDPKHWLQTVRYFSSAKSTFLRKEQKTLAWKWTETVQLWTFGWVSELWIMLEIFFDLSRWDLRMEK